VAAVRNSKNQREAAMSSSKRVFVSFHWLLDWGIRVLNRGQDGKPNRLHIANSCRAFLTPQMIARSMREAIEPDLAPEFQTLTSRELGHLVRDTMVAANVPEKDAVAFAEEVLRHSFIKGDSKAKKAKAKKTAAAAANPNSAPVEEKDPLLVESVKFSVLVLNEVLAATQRKIAGQAPQLDLISKALEKDKCIGAVLWGRMVAGHQAFEIVRASHLSGVIGVSNSEADIETYVAKDDLKVERGAAYFNERERRPGLGYGWNGFDVEQILKRYSLDETINILVKLYRFVSRPFIRGQHFPVPYGMVEIGGNCMEWHLAFQPPITSNDPATESAQRLREYHEKLKVTWGSDISQVQEFGIGIPAINAENFLRETLRAQLGGK